MLARNRYLSFPLVKKFDKENGLEVALFFPFYIGKGNWTLKNASQYFSRAVMEGQEVFALDVT